jgi:glycosyltransferase involved in cell wall biosynthesis/tetratricopeptide (TPR) repeat protein/transcriptional regulator with XRE-family HTH domain
MTDAARPAFGRRVRELRESAGVSLRDLGELTFYSAPQVSRIETGQSLPNLAFAAACDDIFRADGELVLLAQAEIPERWTGVYDFPVGPLRFFGQEDHLARLADCLGSDDLPNVCLLHGLGGAGKTALAIRAARAASERYPDGMFFLDLQGFSEGLQPLTVEEALERVLKMLGVPGRVPQSLSRRIQLYRSMIAGRRLLLVLDDAVSFQQVRHLLPSNESSAALVTSRHPIPALDDCLSLEVRGLSEEAALGLFLHVAQLDSAEPALAAQAGRIISLSSTLPLAVRIVAARLRSNRARTLTQVEQRLGDERSRFSELDDGDRSMAAVFASTLATVDTSQWELLQLLAHHPGVHIDTWTASTLTGEPMTDAEARLDSLALAGIVEMYAIDVYQMHDLLRQYLRHSSGAQPPPDFVQAFRRLFSSYLLSAAAADRLIDRHRYRIDLVVTPGDGKVREFSQKDAAIEWLHRESASFPALTAMMAELGMNDLCWQFCYYLRGYFFEKKPWQLWIKTFQIGLTAAQGLGDRAAEAQMLNGLGLALNEYGALDEAAAYFERARTAFADVSDTNGEFNVVGNYCWLQYYRGEYNSAIRLANEACEFYSSIGAVRNAAIALDCIGRAQLELGGFADALDSLEAALKNYIELSVPDSDIAQVIGRIGRAYQGLAEFDQAKQHYRRAINSAGNDGSSRREVAEALKGLGDIEHLEGHDREAVAQWRAALKIFDAIGAPDAASLRNVLGEQQAYNDNTSDIPGTPTTRPEEAEVRSAPARTGFLGPVRILAVATEWMSGHGGLSTLNRNLCIALARAGAEVYCTVPVASAQEQAQARDHGVILVQALAAPDRSEREALMRKPRLPGGVVPDIIIGHGRVTGPEAQAVAEDHYPAARRFHVIHVDPDEVEWWKPDRTNDAALTAEARTEIEMELARDAAQVVAVGPRLYHRLCRDLAAYPEAPAPLRLDPGFDEIEAPERNPPPGNPLQVLMIGRLEDWRVKGVDLASQAIGLAIELRGPDQAEIELLIRGVPDGEGASMREKVHGWCGRRSLRVVPRSFTTDPEQLRRDLLRATLMLLPSRAESFGLAALEAITMGTPVLISKLSGLGLLLQDTLSIDESARVVVPIHHDEAEDIQRWAYAVAAVLRDTKAAFATAAQVRQVMSRRYTWAMAAKRILDA